MAWRNYLFEWEDFPWFPQTIRQGGLSYLRLLFTHLPIYDACLPLLQDLLATLPQKQVLDLCSGAAGPWPRLLPLLQQPWPATTVLLSDLYPPAHTDVHEQQGLAYHPQPLSALACAANLPGLRTCFSAIHHFEENQVKQLILSATQGGWPIALFDGGQKSWWMVLAIICLHPMGILLLAPLLKPFRWTNLLFVYVIPLIPLYTVWDGVVSILRLHQPEQLLAVARKARPDYEWQSGYLKQGLLSISYLAGQPTSRNDSDQSSN